MDVEDIPWWGWALGIVGIGAGAVAVSYVVMNRPSLAPSPSAPSPAPPTAAPTQTTVELTPGAMTLSLSPGSSLEMTLPKKALWGFPLPWTGKGGIMVTGQASVGSAPTEGTNPAAIVYNGGGAVVTATWWQEGLTVNEYTTTLTITDA